MVSSYPYPPAFLSYMRAVFATPAPFIAAVIAALRDPHDALTGINVDWEPSSGAGDPKPTADDARDYAAFLDSLARAVHAAGPYQVTVAAATWSKIWDLHAIGATAVDAVATMGTYTGSWVEWQQQLVEAVAAIPLAKLAVGLETTNPENGSKPFTHAQLEQRFDALKAAGIASVGMWRAPIPSDWMPFLHALAVPAAAVPVAVLPAAAAVSKRGFAEAASPTNALTSCADLALLAPVVSWAYSWGPAPANESCAYSLPSLSFNPMVWGARSVNATFYTKAATHVLGFNEPNAAKQSNLSPAEAAALWPTVAAKARAAGLQLVAPAPSGSDTVWLKDFFAACGGCKADIVAVAAHPYVCDGPALKTSIDTWAAFGKPVWFTEFNCGDGMKNASALEHLAYMNVALPILDADARVARYAWMSVRDPKIPGAALIAPNGALTALGERYRQA